jgi:hypothetical protein
MIRGSARLAGDEVDEGLLAEDDHNTESRQSESEIDDHGEIIHNSPPSSPYRNPQ